MGDIGLSWLRLKRSIQLATLETRLATQQFRLKMLLKAGFDPSQPRAPAGDPEGGQWTDGGGGYGSSTRNPSFREQLHQGLRESYGNGRTDFAEIASANNGALSPSFRDQLRQGLRQSYGDTTNGAYVQPASDGFNNGPVTGLSRQPVDESKWAERGKVDEETNSVTFDAGDTILVQPSQSGGTVTGSDAGTPGSPEGSHPFGLPPQFYYEVSATPLDNSGQPQASIAPPRWFGPREYSGGIGGAFTQVISANPPGGRVRWTVTLPPQADAGAVYPSVTIYVPRKN